MEEARLFTPRRKKPRLVLDKRFPFIAGLNVGDKGQLKASFELEAERLDTDSNDNEIKLVTLVLKKADLIEDKGLRL